MIAPPHTQRLPETVPPPPTQFTTTMIPSFQAPFFFLLLVTRELTGEGHKMGAALLMGSSQPFCGFSFLADRTPRGRICRQG